MLDEYYSVNRVHRADLLGTYLFVAFNCFFVVFSYVVYPFNTPRPVLGVAVGAVLQAVVMFFIGYYAFRTPVGVEVLKENRKRLTDYSRRDLTFLGRDLNEFITKSKMFLNPDLSVFLLAERFHVSEDEIIDAVHSTHGTNFAEYIDSFRIEYAISLLNKHKDHYRIDDPDDMSRLAHQCGYLERSKFESSFQKIMQTPLKDYHQ